MGREDRAAEAAADIQGAGSIPAAARIYGQLVAKLIKTGTPIGQLDSFIAAHALALDVTLVTNNTKHFAKVPGLSLENWK